jgi:hypothetical protein
MAVKREHADRSRSTNYLSTEARIGLMPSKCTLGHAASRCASFE